MKTVVFLHSYDHFIPNTIAKHQFSSVNLIATEIYEMLSKDSNVSVHYFDTRKITEWRRIKADYLITLVDNLKLSMWYFKPEKVILVGVNKHPLIRLKNLSIASKSQLPQSSLSGHDGIYEPILALRHIDYLICIGNEFTFESYDRYFRRLRIVKTHYNSKNFDLISGPNRKIDSEEVRNSILVSMSSIGFRKNYDFINKLLQSSNTPLNHYRIYVIGQPATPYWTSVIESNKKNLNFTFMGYIEKLNAKSHSLDSILPKIKVALFPTLEEGLPGTMLDLINAGILCLHNRENSGINNSTVTLHSDFRSIENVNKQIDFLMKLDKESYSKLQSIQQLDLDKMFEMTYTFTEAIRIVLYDKSFTENYTRTKFLRLLIDYFSVPFLKFPYVFLMRFYRHNVITFRSKIYLLFRQSVLARNYLPRG